jgi:transcriptional regulator with GAF, ATPase, and Fis domain
MTYSIQSSSNRRPLAKAVHQFSASSNAKWVPINKSFISLTQIILRAAVERLGLANLAVTLRCISSQGYRHLILVSHQESLQLTQLATVGHLEEFIISTEMSISPQQERLAAEAAVTLPIDYGAQRLGYVHAMRRVVDEHVSADRALVADLGVTIDAALQQGLSVLVAELLGIIKRYQTRHRAIYIYGDQVYWIGNSEALRQVDRRLGELTLEPKPVLIRGDKGTGKMIAARSLHCLRHTEMVAFIESSCNEWEEGAAASVLQALYNYARGGTLLLRNLDRLSAAAVEALLNFLDERQRETYRRGAADVGLVFTLSERQLPLNPLLERWLRLNAAALILPNLTERCVDIRDLACFFMRELAPNTELDLTEEAWQILETFEWPANVAQLKQLVHSLVLAASSPRIDAEQLQQFLRVA